MTLASSTQDLFEFRASVTHHRGKWKNSAININVFMSGCNITSITSKEKKSMFFEEKKIFTPQVVPFGPLHLENFPQNVDFTLRGKQCGFPKLHLIGDF